MFFDFKDSKSTPNKSEKTTTNKVLNTFSSIKMKLTCNET